MGETDLMPSFRPRRAAEWIGAVFSLPSYIHDEDEPYRPDVVLWVESGSGLIVGADLVRPGQALNRVADLFRDATRAPLAGKPRVPARLRVASAELAGALRGRIGDVELVAGPTPELDPVIASFVAQVVEDAGDDEEASLLGAGISPDDVAFLFRAAARLYRARPWLLLPSDSFISVACESLGIEDGALSVVGQMGTSFGFALFRSTADAVAYMDAIDEIEDPEAGGVPALPQHLMLTYDERRSIPRSIAHEIRAHGWEVADRRAYPSAIMIDPDKVGRPLTGAELAGMGAIIEVLSDLMEADPDLAAAWEEGASPREQRSEVATSRGPIAVDLRAPLWLPEGEPSRGLDEQEEERDRAALLDRFARSPEGLPEHLPWAGMLVDYAIDYHGSTIAELTPRIMGELLFETIPRKVSAESSEAPEIVAALKALLAFAARELGSASAQRCLDRLPPDAAKRLARELDDPRNFGMAKSFVMSGMKAGYDMGSEAGVAAWMDVYNRQLGVALGHSPSRPRVPAAPSPAPRPGSTRAEIKSRRKAARKARKKSRRR